MCRAMAGRVAATTVRARRASRSNTCVSTVANCWANRCACCCCCCCDDEMSCCSWVARAAASCGAQVCVGYQCVEEFCSVLQSVAVCCGMLQCDTVCYRVVQVCADVSRCNTGVCRVSESVLQLRVERGAAPTANPKRMWKLRLLRCFCTSLELYILSTSRIIIVSITTYNFW